MSKTDPPISYRPVEATREMIPPARRIRSSAISGGTYAAAALEVDCPCTWTSHNGIRHYRVAAVRPCTGGARRLSVHNGCGAFRHRHPRSNRPLRGRGGLAERAEHDAGNEKWTFGAGQGVFAESPDRVYYIQRGSLPIIPPQGRRGGTPAPQVAPNLSFPVANLWRNATNASPPGALFKPGTEEAGDDSDRGKNGVDFLWRTASS